VTVDPLVKLLDRTSRKILTLLVSDARLSSRQISREVNLSPPATAERIRRLEQLGVITGYNAQLDPSKLGYQVLAFVMLNTSQTVIGDIAKDMPQVLECHRVTGRDSFILKVTARSVEDLEALLDGIQPYGAMTTFVVLSSPVTGRQPATMDPNMSDVDDDS
jgi:Lrp/AsnC family leucine-responsive transcriptional regulator